MRARFTVQEDEEIAQHVKQMQALGKTISGNIIYIDFAEHVGLPTTPVNE